MDLFFCWVGTVSRKVEVNMPFQGSIPGGRCGSGCAIHSVTLTLWFPIMWTFFWLVVRQEIDWSIFDCQASCMTDSPVLRLGLSHFATSADLCYLPCKLASGVKFKWSTSDSKPGRVRAPMTSSWPSGLNWWKPLCEILLLELHPLHIINLYPFVSEILDSQFLKMLSLLVLTEKKLGEKDELLIFDIR